MPLCTGFMSKKIICHFQFLQHYSDKNQSLRKSLMSEVSWKQSNKYCSSQLVFRVLVVLPEISLTPSTLRCQKNFICWSFSFLPLLFLPPLPFSFSSLPKEMRGKYKWDTVPSLSLHHLQMVSFFWQFHMQPYKKTWLTYAANFKDVQSCVGPVYAGGADNKRLCLISVRVYLFVKWLMGEKTFLPVVELNPSSNWRQRKISGQVRLRNPRSKEQTSEFSPSFCRESHESSWHPCKYFNGISYCSFLLLIISLCQKFHELLQADYQTQVHCMVPIFAETVFSFGWCCGQARRKAATSDSACPSTAPSRWF